MRVICAFVLCVLVVGDCTAGGRHRGSKQFDYLLFVQRTTAGYCYRRRKCVEAEIRDYWTIHGLWPTSERGCPRYCDPNARFTPAKIADLRADLDKYWPSVTTRRSESFWSYEWTKHGTCAEELKQLSGEHNYFSFSLDLYKKRNLTKYLEQAKIVPNNEKTYEVKDIRDALTKNLQKQINVKCRRTRKAGDQVLKEVRYCISKQLKIIDCPMSRRECRPGPVYYLKKVN